MLKMISYILIIVLICFIDTSIQASWSYNDEDSWPGMCQTGINQSPINIITTSTIEDKHGAHIRGPLTYRGYNNVPVEGINNGHTLKWQFKEEVDSEPPTLSGGPLRGNYTFAQLHLHWLSEHAIDGFKYPLEIHLVHIKTGLSLDEALQTRDGVTVIGILCQVRAESDTNFPLEELMPDVRYLLHHNHTQLQTKYINITRLFSPDPQSYYTYAGSLTTPECKEVVTWIVMEKPLMISDVQYKWFSQVDVGGTYNYRTLQPHNDRPVFRTASCASIILPGFLQILTGAAVLLSCTLNNVYKAANKIVCPILNVKKRIFGLTLTNCAITP